MPNIPERVALVIEVPRGSFVKRELRDGRLEREYVSPVPSPFNYGCVPDTPGEDGDPLDVVVLGPRLPANSHHDLPVVGVVRFVDAGRADDKLVASARVPTLAERRQVERFFRLYAVARRLLNLRRGFRGTTACRGLSWLGGGPPPA